MIIVNYIQEGSQESKKFEAKCLTFLKGTGEFALYYYENTQPLFIKPKYLTAVSVEDPTVKTKEEFNDQARET